MGEIQVNLARPEPHLGSTQWIYTWRRQDRIDHGLEPA
jgi:hypothetical protein